MEGTRKTILDGQRWFPIKNNNASDIPPFSIVMIYGTFRDTEANGYRTYMQADQYDGTLQASLAITGATTIKAGKFGVATQHFPAWVSYDSAETIKTGYTYGPESGSWKITESPFGPFRVMKYTGSPDYRVHVTYVKQELVIGKTDYAITKGAKNTVSIYSGSSSSLLTLADSGWNVDAYARLGSVGVSKWVYVYEFLWGYEIVAAEC